MQPLRCTRRTTDERARYLSHRDLRRCPASWDLDQQFRAFGEAPVTNC